MKRGVPDFLQYFGITCFLLVPVYCGLERTCTPEVKARGPRGACGRALTELLSTACMFYGGYNSFDLYKRNNNGNYLSNEADTELKEREDIRAGLKANLATKREAFSFLVKKSEYHEQGVVCECCYHKCRFRELIDYCAGRDLVLKRSQEKSKERHSADNDLETDNYKIRDNIHVDDEKELEDFASP